MSSITISLIVYLLVNWSFIVSFWLTVEIQYCSSSSTSNSIMIYMINCRLGKHVKNGEIIVIPRPFLRNMVGPVLIDHRVVITYCLILVAVIQWHWRAGNSSTPRKRYIDWYKDCIKKNIGHSLMINHSFRTLTQSLIHTCTHARRRKIGREEKEEKTCKEATRSSDKPAYLDHAPITS